MIEFLKSIPISIYILLMIGGLAMFVLSLMNLIVERVKRKTLEDFSQEDKKLIESLVEERIKNVIARMDILQKEIKDASGDRFATLNFRIEEVKKSIDMLAGHSYNDEISPLIQLFSQKVNLLADCVTQYNLSLGDIQTKIKELEEEVARVEVKKSEFLS